VEHAGKALKKIAAENDISVSRLTPIQKRLIEVPSEDIREIAFHHTVFCQTALPYRRRVERVWRRSNGFVSLSVEAGSALHPKSQEWVDLPLPFGPKARLILIHLDTQAKLTSSPHVELEGSMTAFVKKLLGRDPNGAELREFKDQAAAVAGALFRFAAVRGGMTIQVDTKIVTGFELWYPKDANQHTLWPSYVHLSDEYFSTLKNHAVPLNYHAVSGLQHNCLALDTYKWFAQRLCRVPEKSPAFIPWPLVQAQFGQGYARLRDFRAVFLKTLRAVLAQYPGAKVEANERGLTLYRSRPPVLPQGLIR
jgi:hypothetical protein